MKKILLLLFLFPFFANAQSPIIYPGGALSLGNTTFTFSNGDSLVHYIDGPIRIDTSSTTLWRIGKTIKPVFSNDTIAVRGIMTDTLNPYPHNANDFFVLKINILYNCIVDFWHKYETDSLHAGGIVEFSGDSGLTWMNVADCPAINSQNFYALTDTLISGQPAFTGTTNAEQYSRVQFLNCAALRPTSTGCFPDLSYSGGIYLRFRFVSDSTIDSLSGWIIDSIEIEYPGCGEGIDNINTNNSLGFYPNPTSTSLTITSPNKISQITITNLLGQMLFTHEYNTEQVQVDVADLPSGIYFVKINGTDVRKFVKE